MRAPRTRKRCIKILPASTPLAAKALHNGRVKDLFHRFTCIDCRCKVVARNTVGVSHRIRCHACEEALRLERLHNYLSYGL